MTFSQNPLSSLPNTGRNVLSGKNSTWVCQAIRGHVSKLFVRQSRADVRKFFFGNRVVKIWNSFPGTVEDFASIRKFKSFVERVNLSQYVNFYFFVLSSPFCSLM